MAIVEGEIESLKKLKESLNRSGITKFNSIGEMNRFLDNYESEKILLPTRIENELEAEIEDKKSTLIEYQQSYEILKSSTTSEVDRIVQEFETKIAQTNESYQKHRLFRFFYFLKLNILTRRKSMIKNNLENTVKKNTRNTRKQITNLKSEIDYCLDNKGSIVSDRCKKSIDELTYTKKVIDELYTLIAGSIGEHSVVNALQNLSDDCFLINDFSTSFNPPIYNKKENDRIFSVQIDHVLVCQSGVFLLETKNWSKRSIESLDLRSPVKQILRTSYALFVLLNSDSKRNNIRLERHHWGSKKIPIRNIIVMINEKPKEEFKHVKVLSLRDLIGYIQYFEHTLNGDEVKDVFEYLKNRMRG